MMTITDVADRLRRIIEAASEDRKTAMMQMFGIIFAEETPRRDQWGLRRGLGDGGSVAGASAARVWHGLLGGIDVRPVCGPRGGPGRQRHGRGLGGIFMIRRPVQDRRHGRNAIFAVATSVRGPCGGARSSRRG